MLCSQNIIDCFLKNVNVYSNQTVKNMLIKLVDSFRVLSLETYLGKPIGQAVIKGIK